MLSAALLLLCNSLFLSLHLTGSAGSFPKPLSAARERECLERCAAGDLEARNILVEHICAWWPTSSKRCSPKCQSETCKPGKYRAEENPTEVWWRTSSLSVAPPNAGQLLSGDLRVDSYNRHLNIVYQTYLLLA